MISTAPIALVTCDALPDTIPGDRHMAACLRRSGQAVEVVSWSDPEEVWSRFRAVVIRTTWDYTERLADFEAWLTRLEQTGVPVFNGLRWIRWNLHKGYLRELEARGVRIVPTVWWERGASVDLGAELAGRGWSEGVIKPAVSAGAVRTFRVSGAGDQARAEEVLAHTDAMLQPYQPQVAREGEWSLIFVEGEFSHAVLKRARDGDFRVQEEHGGSTRAATPGAGVLADARRVLEALEGEPPLIARVDGVEEDGRLALMELELIEPELFLEHDPEAPERLARAIARRVGSRDEEGL